MSVATLILGESGTGKSFSMIDLDPKEVLLIQAVKKSLPFKSKEWRHRSEKYPTGNIFVQDNHQAIMNLMNGTKKKIIVIDDFQYTMSNQYMRRYNETGFSRFNDIGKHAWDILTLANNLADDVRVYILSHTTVDEHGNTRIKTIGKMLDDKITIEGMFTIVMRTIASNNEYKFSTQNNGSDTVKTPLEMFDSELIDNDLNFIDNAICEYEGIK